MRWGNRTGSSISVGPAAQVYRFDDEGNKGRFIENTALIGSYDSATIADDKAHAGLIVNYINDKRNNPILTAWGSYINVRVQGFAGLNNYSKSFGQLIPEIAFYMPLNGKGTMVLANRIGGAVTVGKTTFYQSVTLGGHENLLGYRQYRFSGDHSLYNNLELRLKLTDIGGYVLPGIMGMVAFYDIGRVWQKTNIPTNGTTAWGRPLLCTGTNDRDTCISWLFQRRMVTFRCSRNEILESQVRVLPFIEQAPITPYTMTREGAPCQLMTWLWPYWRRPKHHITAGSVLPWGIDVPLSMIYTTLSAVWQSYTCPYIVPLLIQSITI
ncbi:BamA/TamA family outer membrane protein [Paraflavitalea speifideaquila]|uniref:BamA/TamA family outer membrane protein n=1 Tax=Paraflavitalea speifideaquila TaxID=3076558 RepID=UPI0028ED1180|nr:BamA/TamA family outer membrane protein [Paraflavitalea speifideiaquila]